MVLVGWVAEVETSVVVMDVHFVLLEPDQHTREHSQVKIA